eukprot:scaffold193_cov255-Pinguiococcus_pyrenoidosus.AAC.17
MLHHEAGSPMLHHTAASPMLLHTAGSPMLLHTAGSPMLHRKAESPMLHHEPASPMLHRKAESSMLHHEPASPMLLHTAASPMLHHNAGSPMLHRKAESSMLHRKAESPMLHHEPASPMLLHTAESPMLHRKAESPMLHHTAGKALRHHSSPKSAAHFAPPCARCHVPRLEPAPQACWARMAADMPSVPPFAGALRSPRSASLLAPDRLHCLRLRPCLPLAVNDDRNIPRPDMDASPGTAHHPGAHCLVDLSPPAAGAGTAPPSTSRVPPHSGSSPPGDTIFRRSRLRFVSRNRPISGCRRRGSPDRSCPRRPHRRLQLWSNVRRRAEASSSAHGDQNHSSRPRPQGDRPRPAGRGTACGLVADSRGDSAPESAAFHPGADACGHCDAANGRRPHTGRSRDRHPAGRCNSCRSSAFKKQPHMSYDRRFSLRSGSREVIAPAETSARFPIERSRPNPGRLTLSIVASDCRRAAQRTGAQDPWVPRRSPGPSYPCSSPLRLVKLLCSERDWETWSLLSRVDLLGQKMARRRKIWRCSAMLCAHIAALVFMPTSLVHRYFPICRPSLSEHSGADKYSAFMPPYPILPFHISGVYR